MAYTSDFLYSLSRTHGLSDSTCTESLTIRSNEHAKDSTHNVTHATVSSNAIMPSLAVRTAQSTLLHNPAYNPTSALQQDAALHAVQVCSSSNTKEAKQTTTKYNANKEENANSDTSLASSDYSENLVNQHKLNPDLSKSLSNIDYSSSKFLYHGVNHHQDLTNRGYASATSVLNYSDSLCNGDVSHYATSSSQINSNNSSVSNNTHDVNNTNVTKMSKVDLSNVDSSSEISSRSDASITSATSIIYEDNVTYANQNDFAQYAFSSYGKDKQLLKDNSNLTHTHNTRQKRYSSITERIQELNQNKNQSNHNLSQEEHLQENDVYASTKTSNSACLDVKNELNKLKETSVKHKNSVQTSTTHAIYRQLNAEEETARVCDNTLAHARMHSSLSFTHKVNGEAQVVSSCKNQDECGELNAPSDEQTGLGLKAMTRFHHNIRLPGFAQIKGQQKLALFDKNAIRFLGLDPKWIHEWIPLAKVLKSMSLTNAKLVHKKFAEFFEPPFCFKCGTCSFHECRLKRQKAMRLQLNCPALLDRAQIQNGPNSFFFDFIPDRGDFKDCLLYIKASAFFNSSKEITYINIVISRVGPFVFEKHASIVEESGSFDWIVPTGAVSFSQNYATLLGHNSTKDLPTTLHGWETNIVHPDDLNTINLDLNVLDSNKYGDGVELAYRSRKKDGSYIWTKSCSTVVSRNQNGLANRLIGLNTDINRVVDSYERLRNKVFTDILTGLKNRAYLISNIDNYSELDLQPLSFIFADITALKVYNDYLSHAVGDKLLCIASEIISSCIGERQSDIIRISGDEIVCVFPCCSQEELKTIETKLAQGVKDYNINAPIRMPVLFSFGSSQLNLRKLTAKELKYKGGIIAHEMIFKAIEIADQRMQVQKKAAKEQHYALVKAYIEQSLHKKITLDDKRLFTQTLPS